MHTCIYTYIYIYICHGRIDCIVLFFFACCAGMIQLWILYVMLYCIVLHGPLNLIVNNGILT